MKQKIAIIGTGYVGLVAGACFAKMGNSVKCVDKDQSKIDKLKSGVIPIFEPGLKEMVESSTKKNNLHFTTDLDTAITYSDIVFIAVGTPEDEDGSADLRHVKNVAVKIGQCLEKNLSTQPNKYTIVVNKSTVPVGTADTVKEIIKAETTSHFDVVSNPEFLKEGSAISDFLNPDRVIIGTEHEKSFTIMRALYQPFMLNNQPIIEMDTRSAEITKYASNAMLATKISFINEMAKLCDKVGADVTKVRLGMIPDIRIGSHFLYPGIGYGGSCFPKDVNAIIKTASDHQLNFKLLKSVDEVNDSQKKSIFQKMLEIFGDSLSEMKIALWGLAFKPETDDIREAPAHVIIAELLKRGANVNVHDPQAIENMKKIWGNKITYCDDKYAAVEGCDALVLCTEWICYRQVDFNQLNNRMKSKIILDGRNLWYNEIKTQSFDWYGMGTPPVLNRQK